MWMIRLSMADVHFLRMIRKYHPSFTEKVIRPSGQTPENVVQALPGGCPQPALLERAGSDPEMVYQK
jgi:hypothetical protein